MFWAGLTTLSSVDVGDTLEWPDEPASASWSLLCGDLGGEGRGGSLMFAVAVVLRAAVQWCGRGMVKRSGTLATAVTLTEVLRRMY